MKLSGNYLYKFIGASLKGRWEENLRNSQLIFRHTSDPILNDAYEGHFGVQGDWSSLLRDHEKLRKVIYDLNPEDASTNTSSLDSMIEFTRINNDIPKQVINIILSRDRRYRICSFSKKWNHILMWAHYSNNFNGFALAFDYSGLANMDSVVYADTNESVDCNILPPQFVKYVSIPPLINAFDFASFLTHRTDELKDKIGREIIEKCFLSKFRAWRYEQESRAIVAINGEIEHNRPVLARYSKDALKAVLVGPKCEPKVIRKAAASVPADVKFVLTNQFTQKYKMAINKIVQAGDIQSGKVTFQNEA